MKLKIGVSSCLLGEPVRYNGGHKRNSTVLELLADDRFEAVPVCPEINLGVPREPVQLVTVNASIRMQGVESGKDWTPAMTRFNSQNLETLTQQNLSGFIFKSRSPSCATGGVLIYDESEQAEQTAGLFALAFMQRFPSLPIIDEEQLQDKQTRENFIARVIEQRR